MATTRTPPHPRETRHAVVRGPVVAGVEIAAGAVRVAVVRREDARLRVVSRTDATLPDPAVVGGLVADRAEVAGVLNEAFAAAERTQRADRVCVALDSDDVRTFHTVTAFEREESRAAVASSEESRAIREASADAMSRATAATEEDAALRGLATARLHDDVAGLALDGRTLPSLTGHRGRLVEVWTDVTIAPLVLTGAATATLEAAKRRATVVSGAYALGRLLAASGVTEAGVIRLGSDTTSIAVLREGRVRATRVFALGRTPLAARVGRLDDDARVWADCVVASLRGLDGPPPGWWIFVGVPETLLALPRALADSVSELRGDDVEVTPLTVAMVSVVHADASLRPDDLVAVGAGALASGMYDA